MLSSESRMPILLALLTLYIWFAVGVLIFILNRIARFYQITSGRRSYYKLFNLPLLLLTGGAIRYATLGVLAGDVLGDVLVVLGAVSLTLLGGYLLQLMTGSRS